MKRLRSYTTCTYNRQAQVKGEMTGKAMGKHFINLYPNGVNKVMKIDDIEQLHIRH